MKDAIRIMHVITGLGTGGAETMLHKLVAGMDRSRFENRVVSMTGKGVLGPRISEEGIDVMSLDMSPGTPDPKGLWRLWREMRKRPPQIVQTWLYHADLLGLVAAQLARVPNVCWNLRCSYMGEDYYRGMSGLVLRTLARLSTRPDAVLVNSETGRRLHEDLGYRPGRWVTIPNGFDLDRFRPDVDARSRVRAELGVRDNCILIGLIARLDPVKGHDTFLKAAKLIGKELPHVEFVLVCADCVPGNSILAELVPSEIVDRLHLLGERLDIPDVTAALDIATCTSIGEGFPNVVGEAMACGVPCVVSNVGDCATVVADTERVVPPSSPEALASAALLLARMDASERRKLGRAARWRINEFYSLDQIIAQYETLYAGLAGRECSVR